MDLGAGPFETFFRVILPEISVSMVVAAVFAFVTSFDQVETTLFLVRPGDNTLPIEMFLYLQKWQDPTIAALSTVLILFAVGHHRRAQPRPAQSQTAARRQQRPKGSVRMTQPTLRGRRGRRRRRADDGAYARLRPLHQGGRHADRA